MKCLLLLGVLLSICLTEAIEYEVCSFLNAYRQVHGASPLEPSPALEYLALRHRSNLIATNYDFLHRNESCTLLSWQSDPTNNITGCCYPQVRDCQWNTAFKVMQQGGYYQYFGSAGELIAYQVQYGTYGNFTPINNSGLTVEILFLQWQQMTNGTDWLLSPQHKVCGGGITEFQQGSYFFGVGNVWLGTPRDQGPTATSLLIPGVVVTSTSNTVITTTATTQVISNAYALTPTKQLVLSLTTMTLLLIFFSDSE